MASNYYYHEDQSYTDEDWYRWQQEHYHHNYTQYDGSQAYLYDYQDYQDEQEYSEYDHSSSLNYSSNSHTGLPQRGQAHQAVHTSPVEALLPSLVRWFFMNTDKKEWQPFTGHDSLKIETQFRKVFHVEDPDVFIFEQINAVHNDHKLVTVPVKDGLFEVDIGSKKSFPVYWTGDAVAITRGTWFYEGSWQPLDSSDSNEIEFQHRKQGARILSTAETENAIHTHNMEGVRIAWFSADLIQLHRENLSSKVSRAVKDKLGFKSTGTRLHRGYHAEATEGDRPSSINHVIFVLHGIAQKLESGSIVKCCLELQTQLNTQVKKHFPQLERTACRCLVLPIEWRTSLNLNEEMVEACTPREMKSIRSYFNDSVLDLLYYTSSQYRADIIESTVKQLNSLYKMFCDRNPTFLGEGGKISVIAHSLGSVIIYDILSEYTFATMTKQQLTMELEKHRNHAPQTCDISSRLDIAQNTLNNLATLIQNSRCNASRLRLHFNPQNIFFIGSPLPIFLTLRGVTSTDVELLQSYAGRLFNIYYPSDPIAYRLEPILSLSYKDLDPVAINYSKDKNASQLDQSGTKEPDPSSSFKGFTAMFKWNRDSETSVKTPNTSQATTPVADNIFRYDYLLRDTSLNQYMSVLFSHTGYWGNADLAQFMIRHLHAPCLNAPSASPSKM